MSRNNPGEIPMTEADEDVDADVEIAEAEERRLKTAGKSARQRIEELKESIE